MIKKTILIITSIFALIVNCCAQDFSETEQITEPLELGLDYDFKITLGEEEDFGDFTTYAYFKLERNNTVIYIDSSSTEYQFNSDVFPIILQTGDNSFELLFEINDRPNKNYLKRLFVSNDTLTGQDKLPTFETYPVDINDDGIDEFAGYWDYAQIGSEGTNIVTGYNPILYYSVTGNGLKLDSVLTKQRNEMIYGQFYGFSLDAPSQPIRVMEKFNQELNFIRNMAYIRYYR